MTTTVRKAVIPAAGLGTRFLPATKAQPKEMLPVVDKPAIQYVVEEAVRAGIDDILIITGRGKRSARGPLRPHLRARALPRGTRASTTSSKEVAGHHRDGRHPLRPPGRAARPRPRGRRSPASTWATSRSRCCSATTSWSTSRRCSRSMIARLRALRPVGASRCRRSPGGDLGLRLRARPSAVEDDLVRVLDIVEKPAPDDAPSNLAVIGRYVFTPEIFDALEQIAAGRRRRDPAHRRDRRCCSRSRPSTATRSSEGRYDIGKKLDYLRATVELASRRDDLGPPFRGVPRRPRRSASTPRPGEPAGPEA